MNALQVLPRDEQDRLLVVAREHRLPVGDLACLMTRQRGQGSGVTRRGREFDISYDLMLCEYCGNLMPSSVCPAKVRKIRIAVTESLVRSFVIETLNLCLDDNTVAELAENFRIMEDAGVQRDVALAAAVGQEAQWSNLPLLGSQGFSTAIARRVVTCWLCGGDGPAVCRCHNAPPGRKAAPCNMVCNI